MSSPIEQNSIKLLNILEQVNNLPSASGGGSGVDLPELNNPEGNPAEQLASGWELIDENGDKVTGSLPIFPQESMIAEVTPQWNSSNNRLSLYEGFVNRGIVESGTQVELYCTEPDLKPENIKSGIDIFGVLGSYVGSGGGGLPTGITKIACGTKIPTDDVTYLDIQHGLGVAPNFIVWFVENNVGTTGVAGLATDGSVTIKQVRMNTTASTVYNVHYVTHGYNASTAFGQQAGKYANSTDMTATIARMRTASPYLFKAGYKYHWICGVLDNVL